MKLPLSPNSFLKSRYKTPLDSPEKLFKEGKPKSDCATETHQRWTSECDSSLNPYLKILPEHRRRHNVSLFNFYANKQPKKLKNNRKCEELDQKESKRYMQEENIIRKKIKPAFSSFSTEKLQILPNSSKEYFEKFIEKTDSTQQELSPEKECVDRNPNKFNESMIKNTKFDRKKYMYYRYRKKNSPQKNNPAMNELQDKFEIHRLKPSKALFNQMNVKTEEENKFFDENGANIAVEYKYTFFGVLPARNKSFSEAKCKLTIQPIPRQNSSKQVERKIVMKTTREITENKELEQSENKIFTQAVHLKPRKSIYHSKEKYRNENPEKHKSERKEDQILGWNLDEEFHMEEEEYF